MSTKSDIKEKFSDKDYPIYVIGRHIDVTDAMKNYALDKFKKIERFGGRVVDAYITMDVQKNAHSVHFLINVNNTVIKVSEQSNDMYASIDLAINVLKEKLSRYVDKLHDHHAKGNAAIDMIVNVVSASPEDEINDQIEEENLNKQAKEFGSGKVLKQETRHLKVLTRNEAIMKIELSGEHFMVYRSEEDQKLKVIYKRNDGNFGIIEIEK